MPMLALIADIRSSRQIKKRAELQTGLGRCLDQLNQENQGLLSPYTITLGDEFQALFSSADRVMRDILGILSDLHPVNVRFALGVGDISTEINSRQALGMDGPAFYRAREAMTHLKSSDDLFRIEGLPEATNRLCNHSLQLFSHMCSKWRHSRFKILVGLMDGLSVRDLAGQMQLSDKAIYKNIDEGALDPVQGLLEDITFQLNQALE
ncbi:hypothetical protein BTA51_22345 [Hahella sp. CCB-MM4]|uniref:SatD family protein n=1 Tax=Hahella sp. (strain CCB-MM4) TaxID=1926491 RepID=UPI000B9B3CF0|nr:SatD family protein [Hahella sp. CCB-MM4]OZG71122.1 hypothetical protein BTA51_22345 [Hahella sp. CCB-MM4]